MTEQDERFEKSARKAYERTGAPHGVMQPEELVATATEEWQSLRSNISVEDRKKFEPILEALLSRTALSSPDSIKTFGEVVGSSRSRS